MNPLSLLYGLISLLTSRPRSAPDDSPLPPAFEACGRLPNKLDLELWLGRNGFQQNPWNGIWQSERQIWVEIKSDSGPIWIGHPGDSTEVKTFAEAIETLKEI